MDAMRRIIIMASVLCVALIACKHDVVYKEVGSDKGLFTVLLPEYMESTDTIFPGVSILQYANDSVPLYVVGFDTTREGLNETTLEAFYDSTLSQPNMPDAQLDKRTFKLIDGDSAYTTRLVGTIMGDKLAYHMATIATRTHFFYLQVWTKAVKEKDLQGVMDKILSSFHDKNHKKV
jgi:hypothetical protein